MMPPTVLLVEDEANDELLTREGLRRSGILLHASVWNDSPDALCHLLDPLQPLPALVVLDYRMPKMGGLEVLIALRSESRTRCVPIVILSSSLSPHQVEECMAQGATACIEKPTSPEEYVADVALMIRFFLALSILPQTECPASALAFSGSSRFRTLPASQEAA